MDEYAQKIDAVGVLTGGSPRMAILLYELMSKGKIVDVEKAFVKLLDENTPYYQDIFRLLSAEKRKVFDTLISIGRPAMPKEIAKRARLDEKTVNTLLRRLEKDGYVSSRREGKITKYEVRERLFRLWRELRQESFAIKRLSILIEFLELWYSAEERKVRFLEHLECLRLDETRAREAREASYWFLSLPKGYKKELIPQVVEEIYEAGEVDLLDEFLVYKDKELKEEAIKIEFKILFRERKYEEVLKKADDMIKLDESKLLPWVFKGRALERLERYEEAIKALSKAIELTPKNAIAWYSKGSILEDLGRYEEALEVFTKAIELDPKFALAWFEKGVALESLGRHEEALEPFSKVIGLNVPEPYIKGTALGGLGRYEEALEVFSKATEVNPEPEPYWHGRGKALINLGRYEEALEALLKVLELDPKHKSAWYDKGMVLGNLRRHEEALEAFSKAIELDPKFSLAWDGKGLALGNLGRYEGALEAFSKAVELNPNFDRAWYNKGKALGNLGRHEGALEAFSKAIELDPEFALAWLDKGMVLSDLKRHEEALEAFLKAIEFDPKFSLSWDGKGFALGNLGRYEEALEAFSKANELNPKDTLAWYGKGEALMDLERNEEALDVFSKAIELDPKLHLAWFYKGEILENLERHGEALVVLSKAIKLVPEHACPWRLKGEVHLRISLQEFKKSNYGNALENLKSALDAFDTFSTLLEDKEKAKAKEEVSEDLMAILKELIATKNVEAVEMALLAIFEKKEELKALFEPIYIAVEIVKSKDVNKYYDLQVERREVVADIVKKLTCSEELLPVEYRSR